MKINEYNQMMAYLTKPDKKPVIPKSKPKKSTREAYKEYLEIRPFLDAESQMFIEKELGFAMGGSVETPKRGLVDEPGSYAGKPKIELNIKEIKKLRDQGLTTKEIANKLNVSTSVIEKRVKEANLPKAPFQKLTPERLKFLNEAAKKYGYKDFASVKGRDNRINVAKEATRRQKGVPIGKGSPGKKLSSDRIQQIINTHWSKKPKAEIKKIMESPGYVTRDLNKVKDQMNILKAAQSGKYTTAEEIRKAVGLTKEVFNDKVDRLYTNLYTQIGNMNKKNVKSYVRKEFLPHNLDQLEEIKNQLGKIKGFEAAEQRNIWTQISNAYGQNGETPNRKAFEETMKKAGQYFEVKNALQKKFPNIKLDLDHPLDYKTLEGLGKKGEKFLYVTPINTNVNRGVKEVLGKRYRDAIQVNDKKLMLQIEKLADDIGTTVGKVRGSKVIDYGTTSLRKSDLGSEIISNLKQQNIMSDKLSKMKKSGELKTRLGEIGITRPKDYNIQKISDSDIKKASNLLAALGCPGKAMGGRIGFQTGVTPTAQCIARGAEKINFGNIKPGAEARNATQFLKGAYKLGKNVTKFGVIPEAMFVTGESLLRMGLGDTKEEAFNRATDFLRPGDQTEKANILRDIRTLNPETASIIVGANDYKKALENLKNVRTNTEIDIQQNDPDFTGITNERLRDIQENKIKQAEQNIKNKFQPEAVTDFAAMKEAESQDIAKSQAFFPKFVQKARDSQIDSDIETIAAPEIKQKKIAAPMLTIDDLAFSTGLDRDTLDTYRTLSPDINKAVLGELFSSGRANLANQERLFGTSGLFFGQPISQKPAYDFAGGGIAKMGGVSSGPAPKSGPTPQGLDFLLKRGR